MSQIYINDSNYQQFINPTVNGEKKLCSYFGMWRSKKAFNSAKDFGDLGISLIPKSEWKDRIKERIDNKLTARNFVQSLNIPPLNQESTSYCWINGPTHGLELSIAQSIGRYLSLSPASGGARIKNFRNVGGWGSEALDWMIEHGLNETKDWPANAIDRRYLTDENIKLALRHRVREYYKLNNWEEVVSAILHGLKVAVGYNWWAHEVLGCDLNMNEDLDIRNSWGNWGDNGFAYLQGNKKYPDDAVVIVNSLVI